MFGLEVIDPNGMMTSLVNCNSPMKWDESTRGMVPTDIRHKRAIVVLSFMVPGDNAPTATAASLVRANA